MPEWTSRVSAATASASKKVMGVLAGWKTQFRTSLLADVRGHLLWLGVISAVVNVLYLAPTIYMLQVYDRVLVTGSIFTLLVLSLVVLLAVGVLAAYEAIRSRLLGRLSLRLERSLAATLLSVSLRDPIRRGRGSLRELDNFRQGVTSPASAALLDLPWTPLYWAACFLVHFWIELIAVGGAAVVCTLAWLNERRSRNAMTGALSLGPQIHAVQDADLRSAGAVRSMGMVGSVAAARIMEREQLVRDQVGTSFVSAHYTAAIKFSRLAVQSLALGVGAWLAIDGAISAGAIIAGTVMTARAFAPIEQLVAGWRTIVGAWVSLTAIETIIVDVGANEPRVALPLPLGRIDVERVSATVPGEPAKPVLRGVSLTARSGEVIGIVGPSGAGKSTLARLLANAAAPDAGEIRIDGARYVDWDAERLGQRIGYLPQGVDLLYGTVAENIARFSPSHPESEAIVHAAIAAGAHELILRLPHAYETFVGPQKGLSPGQAQRIALARALFGDPTVLVLDEPNAHLDSDGDAALQRSVIAARDRGAVVFVATHRPSLVSIADKILVMRGGEVVEFGARDRIAPRLLGAGATGRRGEQDD